ncbi:hypothetical protein RO07_13295 [Pandoraea pulmonicola]|uniref:Flagellar motor switch protein n=2 Tax=Pandoraea pulmonicola TaxID=93221 RepID=A0AAJ4ZB43_PANPU|nr:hypothetical protein RO07_13295 [Pandoraea pulmonicola]SUA90107.1 Flagellar motor switch protein [Pandoraea pulmonicola]
MLGRPTHLLGTFGEALKQHLGQQFIMRLSRRAGASLRVTTVTFSTHSPQMRAWPWRHQSLGAGRIGVHMERALLLKLLEVRYGTPHGMPGKRARSSDNEGGTDGNVGPIDANGASESTDAMPLPLPLPTAEPQPAIAAETATERRLAGSLAAELAQAVARCIAPEHGQTPPDDVAPVAHHPDLFAVCRICSAAGEHLGDLGVSLDGVWQDRLFEKLSGTLQRPPRTARGGAVLSHELRVTLTARLLEMEVPFGELLRLRKGDILPVRMPAAARVFAGDSDVFTAIVAEHNGKLCLTSFNFLD